MLEKFKAQLEENRVVTEDTLFTMKNKTYHNGDDIKVGDKLLFGMTLDEDESGNKSLTMIIINENQLDLYEPDERHQVNGNFVPVIKLK